MGGGTAEFAADKTDVDVSAGFEGSGSPCFAKRRSSGAEENSEIVGC
jgi:hypothetical protein